MMAALRHAGVANRRSGRKTQMNINNCLRTRLFFRLLRFQMLISLALPPRFRHRRETMCHPKFAQPSIG